ncbi:MAG: hypothetical protein JOY71_17725, partial [Acetobacteraceae bacterium]|nr:hypothetical protein [Acetobacteraceae bacterium]
SVGVTDNFFELGGDSILSIQIVARAIHHGLSLSPRQLFLHQTIEELAAVAEETGSPKQIEPVGGEAPLTPIQHWFFEADQAEPHHYNQAILLEVSPRLDIAMLQEAVRGIWAHHSGLRLRFFRDGSSWRQVCASDGRSPEVTYVDWSSDSTEQRSSTLESVAARLQSGLNLTDGPLMRIAYFRGCNGESGRLLWIAHHLLTDGVSWRILLEDLDTACRQLEEGEAITLLPATAPFTNWARRLQDYAHSSSMLKELRFWQDICNAAPPPVVACSPADGEAPLRENISGNTRSQTFELSSTLTDYLLHDVPPVYHTGINDILLTALVETFADWTGSRALLLDLEGHGREELFPDLDVARTTGWFTTIFPVHLRLRDAASPGEAIKSVKEQLKRIPNHGIGYGLLKYLNDDPAVRASLSKQQPQLSFNYLGQLDLAMGKSRYFRPALEPSGPPVSPLHRCRHLVEIDASIISGRLLVTWRFVEWALEVETVRQLGTTYLDRLQVLIEHCRSPDAGGFTPSDFAAARVGSQNLDRLLSKLRPQP